MESLLIVSSQLLLPLVLIGWYAVLPPAHLTGLFLLATGLPLFLLAMARLLLWAALPWWLPWLYCLAALGITLFHLLQLPLATMPIWPEGSTQWLSAASAALLLLMGLWSAMQTLSARIWQADEVIDIANPLGPGHYLTGHGGSVLTLNQHLRTLDSSVPRFQTWRGQSYAYDIVGINRFGTHASGWRPRDPSRYAIFGAAVHAPCAGIVLQAESDLPDLPVPERDTEQLMGNHVLLQCRDDLVLVFAHLQQGSVTVSPGQEVAAGTMLGRVGNSGNTSEPHLHIHAQRPGTVEAPLDGEPLPLTIDGRVLLRNSRFQGKYRHER